MDGRISLLGAFVRRDWVTARSYRFAFALQAIDSTMSLALFFFLGRIVDGTNVADRAGTTGGYFGFVLIGLVVTELMHVGVSSFAGNLRRDQTTGTLEALFVTPAPQALVVVAGSAFDFIRAAGLVLVLLGLGVTVFGVDLHLEAKTAPLLLLAVPATVAVFTGLGIAVAAATIVFKKTDVLVSFIFSGLALFSGVYFPLDVLPRLLRALAHASPLTWALDAFRAALVGGDVATYELVCLGGAGLMIPPVALWLFRASIRHARRAGSLGQY